MRKSGGIIIGITTVFVALFGAAAAIESHNGDSAQAGTGSFSAHTASTRSYYAMVVAEMAGRPHAGLSESQRINRTANIERLAEYGEAGRFIQNDLFPGFEMSYFIDSAGTRCALAHLLDKSGHGAITHRLATEANHAVVPAIAHDDELNRWLDEQGLTLAEASLIQFPGFAASWSRVSNLGPPAPLPFAETESNSQEAESIDARTDEGPDGPGSRENPGGGGAVPGANSAVTSAARGGSGGGWSPSWEQWWLLNRSAFLNLRERYRDNAGESRGPSQTELDEKLRPFIKNLDAEGEVKGTAILAWARIAKPEEAGAVVEAVHEYIADSKNPFREYLLLALGIIKHDRAVRTLREIVSDTKEGRAALHGGKSLDERTRSFAAVALGTSGDVDSIDTLLAALKRERRQFPDFRVACATSLGLLARDADDGARKIVRTRLLKELTLKRWPRPALAAIPTALAKAHDPKATHELKKILRGFRGSREVRQSCALALGLVAPGLEPDLVDILITTARRDADAMARRFAILSLGELSAREPLWDSLSEKERADHEKAAKKVAHYFHGAFKGLYKQPTDTPLFCLAAGLFARRFADQADAVRLHLERILKSGKVRGDRAAAAIAIALIGDKRGVPTLRTVMADASDSKLRAYAAEALGILGDKSVEKRLMTFVTSDASSEVRYRAGIGLAYMADQKMVAPLVGALADTHSETVRAILTQVIGEIGDRAAIPALMEMAADETRSDRARSRAIVALGMIGQTSDFAWNWRIKRGSNYATAPATLWQVLAIF
ncbi:MAG: HEAT repeat domain-containing protein [Planctomycetota bacterium]